MNNQRGNEPARPSKKLKKSKDNTVKEIAKWIKHLLIEHKTPCLFFIQTKFGQIQFGSSNVVEKFKRDFEHDDNWKTTFERDTEELIEDQQNHNVEVDEYDDARVGYNG